MCQLSRIQPCKVVAVVDNRYLIDNQKSIVALPWYINHSNS